MGLGLTLSPKQYQNINPKPINPKHIGVDGVLRKVAATPMQRDVVYLLRPLVNPLQTLEGNR